MYRCIHFCEKNFSLGLLFFAFIGFVFPMVLAWMKPGLSYLLMAIMFFSSLRIDLRDVAHHIKNPKYVLLVSIFFMVVYPVIIYFFFDWLLPEFALGFFLLSLAPTAMASPALAQILGGSRPLALLFVVVQHFMAPFTITYLVYLFAGSEMQLSLMDMLLYLIYMIFIPITLAQLIEWKFPAKVEKVQAYIPGIINMILWILVTTTIAIQRDPILDIIMNSTWVLVVVLLYGLLRHFGGYLLVPFIKHPDRMVNLIMFSYPNTILVLVLALEFFGENEILVLTIDEIVLVLGLVTMKHLISRNDTKRNYI